MSGRLSDRTALVTGSSSGIGKGIALLFAEEAARVMVTGLEADLCNRVADEIRAAGGEADHLAADLTVDSEVEGLVRATVDRFGGLDILVNNAGAPGMARERDGSVEATDPALWDATYRIDVRSVMLATRLAVPHLERSATATSSTSARY